MADTMFRFVTSLGLLSVGRMRMQRVSMVERWKAAGDGSLSLVWPLANDGHVEQRHTHGSQSENDADDDVVPFLIGVSPG